RDWSSDVCSSDLKEKETIRRFITKIKELAAKLESLGDFISEEKKGLVLTHGFPESYTNVVMSLYIIGNLDGFTRVSNIIINEEVRQAGAKNGSLVGGGKEAFFSTCRTWKRLWGRKNEFRGNCHYCGTFGHKEYECSEKQP